MTKEATALAVVTKARKGRRFSAKAVERAMQLIFTLCGLVDMLPL